MKPRKLTIEVQGGIIAPSDAKKLRDTLCLYEGRVDITMDKHRRNMSLSQRGYYMQVICTAFQHGAREQWGEELDKEEAHDNLKKLCNYIERVDKNEVIRITKSTKYLTTLDSEVYFEKCRRQIFTYFGIVVPLPGEQSDIQFNEQ